MLKAGEIERLIVSRFTDNGAYLINTEEEEVLLPNRYVDEDLKVGDEVKVFVYLDSEERIVACTEMPFIIVGEVALLECVDVSGFGAFLDWGMLKNLFIPFSNQSVEMEVGRWYIVYAYRDEQTGRVVATTKLGRYINNDDISVSVKEEVEIVVAKRNDFGFRVVINNKHWGMIYHNQIFKQVEIGDILTGYIVRITDDNRIDVSLSKLGVEQFGESADVIMSLLTEMDGVLPVGDNSTPDEIYKITNMSKKMFKRGAGKLLKEGKINIGDFKIEQVKNKK